eukprot:139066_1
MSDPTPCTVWQFAQRFAAMMNWRDQVLRDATQIMMLQIFPRKHPELPVSAGLLKNMICDVDTNKPAIPAVCVEQNTQTIIARPAKGAQKWLDHTEKLLVNKLTQVVGSWPSPKGTMVVVSAYSPCDKCAELDRLNELCKIAKKGAGVAKCIYLYHQVYAPSGKANVEFETLDWSQFQKSKCADTSLPKTKRATQELYDVYQLEYDHDVENGFIPILDGSPNNYHYEAEQYLGPPLNDGMEYATMLLVPLLFMLLACICCLMSGAISGAICYFYGQYVVNKENNKRENNDEVI